jgi:DNA invertase Pin-like site-specific DNA recombinase
MSSSWSSWIAWAGTRGTFSTSCTIWRKKAQVSECWSLPSKGIYRGRPVTFDRARIVALRKEGMGATEIANAVGCKRGNVYKALKAVGLN